MHNDIVSVIKGDGRRWDEVFATVDRKLIVIDTDDIPLEEGDRVERKLRKGIVERYLVLEAVYYDGFGGIPPHYQLQVQKDTTIPRRSGTGSVVYNVTGPGARFNLNSVDASTNIVNLAPTELFAQIVAAIEAKVTVETERRDLLGRLKALEEAQSTPSYLERYQQLVAAAANHVTVIAPFLPALTQLLNT